MTPPSPSQPRPYTRATASAIAAGKRRANDSDDENEGGNYFQSQHETHSPQSSSRAGSSRATNANSPGADLGHAEEDVEMTNVRLTMDNSNEGILEPQSQSSSSTDQDARASGTRTPQVPAMSFSCGESCSGGFTYDLRSHHYRGKENIPPLEDDDWHARSQAMDQAGRLLATPGAGPSRSHRNDDDDTPNGVDENAYGATNDVPVHPILRRSRTTADIQAEAESLPMDASPTQLSPPTISVSSADPPALSTRARSSRRRTTRSSMDDDHNLEDTDREDEGDRPQASSEVEDRQRDVLTSGISSNSAGRKRRCIRSSTSLQIPRSTSSTSSRPSLSPSGSASSFQVPTLRSATPNNAAANAVAIAAASASRRVTRTTSTPSMARNASFSRSSSTSSTAMYSVSCAANKRRLSTGPTQPSAFGMGLAELAKASGSNSASNARPGMGRKRQMSISSAVSVRSEASVSAMSTASYASYSVTSSCIPQASQNGTMDDENMLPPGSSSRNTRATATVKPNKSGKEEASPSTNRRLFTQPLSLRSAGHGEMRPSSSNDDSRVHVDRFSLARTDTATSSVSSQALVSSPTSECSGASLFPSTPVDESYSSPIGPISRLNSDDIELLDHLALTPKRSTRLKQNTTTSVATPDLTRSPSASSRSDMDPLLNTPSSRVSSTFATPRAADGKAGIQIEIEGDESQVATPTARRQYADGYKALKAALKCSSSGSDSSTTLQPADGSVIIGRDQEKAVIRGYLSTGEFGASDESAPGVNQTGLYISGPPGTGKTATVGALISEYSSGSRVAFINCMGLVGKKDEIWSRIAAAWGFDEDRNGKEKPERITERGLRSAQLGLTFILVLDEVDALLPAKPVLAYNQILRSLFALPHNHPELDIKLIAIANSLDLTVRKSVASVLGNHAPFNLTFKAYGSKEMTEIIKSRIHECTEALAVNHVGISPVIVDDKAIELVGRKVEANNGDLRMCLSVMVEAINATETEWRKKASSSGTEMRIPPFKVSLSHVLKALSSYNKLKANAAATSSGTASSSFSHLDNKIRSLNVQVRMILLAWLISRQRLNHGLRPVHTQAASSAFTPTSGTSSTESITTDALYPTYTYVLSSAASPFPPASQPDFMDLLMQAEVLGLLSVEGGDGLTPSKSKARRGRAKERVVELLVKEEDLKVALGIRKDAESETAIAMDSEIRAIWFREETRWLKSIEGRQRALDSARRQAENGTAGFVEDD
ncbi:hypothetical protein QFC21_005483 [Naganishia friedmannii]|uniref:Uncharacterized protein n=1 Tax=Naganishia friedmannii TaxID=89922 RepID=A0ACC2VAL6_9TREE|nr:hypothetical protein QFC21_005483 [Naganishia friedmannii]